MKPFPLELVPVAICLLHVGPCEEKYSILFPSASKCWNTVTRCSLSSSPGTKEPSPGSPAPFSKAAPQPQQLECAWLIGLVF